MSNWWQDECVAEVFICTCYGEGVVVWHDDEFTYLSIWGSLNNVSLKWRLKQAWAALRGRATTEVVLSPPTAAKLATTLTDRANVSDTTQPTPKTPDSTDPSAI